ncbi:hypothetical protein GYMLUDRAFT_236546 [Collybiopsis luxurians FD-317 M1]|nr:hypothetical protein GYMLUDRAFT_236546 [Collybiopsis luxurians FD-317 M1]
MSSLQPPTRSASLPTRSFQLSTILEDIEQYDFPGLNLGTESLAATPKYVPGSKTWTLGSISRSRLQSLEGRRSKQEARKVGVDRDCMICYDIALRPARTQCCGKLFCEAHLHDWLAGSSNRCPWCSAYCHPDTGVISLASPASPTSPSQRTRPSLLLKGETTTRSRSSSSSSSFSSRSNSSSMDPNSEQDDNDRSLRAGKTVNADSFHLWSFFSKVVLHFLDDPSLETSEVPPPDIYHASENWMKYHTLYQEPPSASEITQSSALANPSSQAQNQQMVLTPWDQSLGSEIVGDNERTALALISKIIGKVLTLVALVLVFWVLTR